MTRMHWAAGIALAAMLSASSLLAQDSTQARVAVRLVAEPGALTIVAGQSAALRVVAFDANGSAIPNAQIRLSGPRNAVQIASGNVKGLRAGRYQIAASVPTGRGASVSLQIPVTVTWPAITRVTITPAPGRLYTGITLAHRARAFHADSSERQSPIVSWVTSDPAVATVDRFGNVTGVRAGRVRISAIAEGDVRATTAYDVAANPVRSLAMNIAENSVRTGDVVHLNASASRADGSVVADVPITWAYTYVPDDTVAAPGATGVIDRGLFAAEVPGRYTLLATAGTATARKVIDVRPRDVRRRISVIGRGTVTNVATTDFWPWAGKDGRDYALMGTIFGDGYAYVFDITKLGNIVKTDSIKLDARTINDVTVSPDGRYGVLAREGASDRKNGVVLLDLSNPAHPQIASRFDDGLTGGVHNVFATNDYLYAISNGDKYMIIDVRDIRNPRFVGEYDHPESRIHDLWVHDGIAYSSEWGTGVVVVDVGNGKYGGTPQKPVLITTHATTSGATHEVFPYFQKSTGKIYLFLGDEIMNRQGRVWEGTDYLPTFTSGKGGGLPQTSAGYTHIVDFTDPKNPKNIAKYHQEEFGSHDIIVEDDILYQAYYEGGVRIVDVSGELVGNLAEQRREIAVFKPFDPDGRVANAAFVANVMPWKGHILFTDANTGLWAAKLEPKPEPIP